jgi:uncharacterized protein (TIGR00730 family)
VRLVYGGGNVGLMGVVASQAMACGGEVVGVIPTSLEERELAHKGLTELIVVPDMHVRKRTMADLADGFIAMPGGIGTLEEIFEIWTWAQLGYHAKPCAFFNLAGYFDTLLAFVDHMVAAGFMYDVYRKMVTVSDDPAAIVAAFKAYTPPGGKWQKSTPTDKLAGLQ